MYMEITERTVDDVTVLALKGRIILEEEEHPLRTVVDMLVEQGRLKLVLDLREATYIDSAGVGVLVAKYVSVRRRGGTIKLLHLGPRVRHVLEITKLTGVFEIFESEDEAVRSFSRPDNARREVLSL